MKPSNLIYLCPLGDVGCGGGNGACNEIIKPEDCSPLVLLVMLGAVSGYSINSITKTNGWVDHTRVVLAEAASVVASAVDMETGMRGYLSFGG